MGNAKHLAFRSCELQHNINVFPLPLLIINKKKFFLENFFSIATINHNLKAFSILMFKKAKIAANKPLVFPLHQPHNSTTIKERKKGKHIHVIYIEYTSSKLKIKLKKYYQWRSNERNSFLPAKI